MTSSGLRVWAAGSVYMLAGIEPVHLSLTRHNNLVICQPDIRR